MTEVSPGGASAPTAEAPQPALSVIAPVYNERDNLEELHRQVLGALRGRVPSFEVVWIDDCSSDGSLELLQGLTAGDGVSRILRLASHRGQSAGIWQGLQSARGALVATIDTDLQNDPGDLPRLLDALETQGVDLVSGVRAQRNDTALRRLASRIANRVRSLVLGDPFRDVGCSLKVYRREFLTGMPRFDGLHRFLPVLAIWNGARWAEVEVSHRPRLAGESKYGAVRGRLGRGVLDLLAMLWLRRRWLGRCEAHEVGVAKSREPATSARSEPPRVGEQQR